MRRSPSFLLLIAVFFTACSTNNVTVDNSLQKYFDSAGVHGTFGLYDNGQGHFTIYNLARFRDSAYAPGETFNVLLALVALQTGVAANENSIVLSTNLGEAGKIKSSDTSEVTGAKSLKEIFSGWGSWYLGTETLAELIGKDTVKKWVDSLQYGNRNISDIIDSGEIQGRLKITADEQLGLTKKLYFDQLPFFQRPQKIVRSMFQTERDSNYLLAYTQGTWKDKGKTMAWVLGWEEENKHPYFFVLNFETSDSTMDVRNIGPQLVKKILAPMGFFAGKK